MKKNRHHQITNKRYYEATQPSYYRVPHGGNQSADVVIDRSRAKLRNLARYLDENYDLVVGLLNDLVVNIVGTGVSVEPMVRYQDGRLCDTLNAQINELWQEFWEWPDVTAELSGDELDQLLCRSWLRDGEVFIHHILGVNPTIQYRTRVPYMIEALESDFIPYELNGDNVIHGIAKNAWNKPIGYYVYKKHPGSYISNLETKYVNAERMTHIKFVRRLHQTRGVSILHSVLNRLDDIRDYEESERIAARIAAALTGYIRRNGEYEAPLDDETGKRLFEMEPGLIYDNLLPGEDVGLIKSDRPNQNLEPFRDSQVRAICAGTSTRFSSVSKNYNGTYSAQRQELVEGRQHYTSLFIAYKQQFKLPIWHRFIDILLLNGTLKLPEKINKHSLYKPDFRQPSMPWIDPAKETKAFESFILTGLKSRQQIMRDIGGSNLSEVTAQIKADTMYDQVVNQINGQQPLPLTDLTDNQSNDSTE